MHSMCTGMELSTRRVEIGGIACTANGLWMAQIARNVTDEVDGFFKEKRYLIHEFVAHYHLERNHQGLGNRLIVPPTATVKTVGPVQRSQRLGGMLNYYHRAAA